MPKKIVITVGKLLLCAFVFYAGMILAGAVSTAAGLPVPDMPAGSDPAAMATALMVASLLVAVCLALLSARLAGNFVLRWLSLVLLVCMAYGVNTYLEASIFTAYSADSSINVIMSLLAGLVGGAAAAWLFPPINRPGPFRAIAASFFQQFGSAGWIWRCLTAIAAFPAIYYFFGSLISPIVLPYYQQGGELMIPGLRTLLPVLLLRSIFFLVSSFMIVAAWGKTRLSLTLSLGVAMFMLVGGIGMLLGSFLPMVLRVVHSFEILADSMCYAAVLALLFRSRKVEPQMQPDELGLKSI